MSSEIFAYTKRQLLSFGCCLVGILLPLHYSAFAASPATERSERMRLSPKSLLQDIAVLEYEIVVVGERGHILKSKDEGTSWRQIIAPTRASLTSVFFVDNRHGWATGHSGVILMSSDSGDSWTLVSDPDPEISYFDILFVDEQNGYFVGAYGEIAKTTDGAKSLEKLRMGEEELHFYAIEQSPNGNLFLAGERGQIFKWSNQDREWSKLHSPYEGSLFGLICLDDENLLTFGLRGHLFRSANAGNSWEKIELHTEAIITAGIRLSSGNLLIASVTDQIFMSSDEGHTFYKIEQPGIDGTVGIAETASTHTVLFCGRHGVLSVATNLLEASLMKAESANE
ncbi:MAG: YCF48-related protein [Verrucomicrobia bacterium]|nr:YCF48-related protein [Verrucomicrobiota bacterium]